MKRLFTLLVFAGLASTSFAQDASRRGRYGGNDDIAFSKRNDWNNDDRNKRSYYFSRREMQMEINEINRVYNRKVEDVRNNWHMRSWRKRRMINELESRRGEEVKAVYMKFKDPRNRYDDHIGHR